MRDVVVVVKGGGEKNGRREARKSRSRQSFSSALIGRRLLVSLGEAGAQSVIIVLRLWRPRLSFRTCAAQLNTRQLEFCKVCSAAEFDCGCCDCCNCCSCLKVTPAPTAASSSHLKMASTCMSGHASQTHDSRLRNCAVCCLKVDAFYDFWYTFKSWREFPHPDEEDIEQVGAPRPVLVRRLLLTEELSQ